MGGGGGVLDFGFFWGRKTWQVFFLGGWGEGLDLFSNIFVLVLYLN